MKTNTKDFFWFKNLNSSRVLVICSQWVSGAHFKKNFVRLSWLIDILYNFSWGFQKYNFFSRLDTPNQRTTSAHTAHVPARLQAAWAELVRRLGVSNFEKNYIFGILMKNCTKYQSAIKIRDVAGTPNIYSYILYIIITVVCWWSDTSRCVVCSSDGSNTNLSNIERTRTSFFKHRTNSNMFIN